MTFQQQLAPYSNSELFARRRTDNISYDTTRYGTIWYDESSKVVPVRQGGLLLRRYVENAYGLRRKRGLLV